MFLKDCAKVYERHQKPMLRKDDLIFLWNSQCGEYDKRVMVWLHFPLYLKAEGL